MSEQAATPAVPSTEAPVVPPATPAIPATETVTLSKEQHDQLARDAARATSNQSKADRYDKLVGKKGGHFGAPTAPVTPPTSEEMAEAASAEDRKAERGLLALAADPTLRAVLDADPTLFSLLRTNPLAVLPMLASDALDADDAVSLVKEALLKRAAPATPPATPPVTPPATPPNPIVPPNAVVNEELEAARKLPGTEQAIAAMVKARAGETKK